MTTATHLGAQGAQRPTRSRYLIMVMLFITVVINYLDRSNLSIAAPALKDEFGLDTVHEGLILSAFGWTYAAMQIPGGWLVDRVAPRVLYAAALILWSAATFFMGFASSFIVLFVLRLAVGALEAETVDLSIAGSGDITITGTSRATATRDLHELVAMGALTQTGMLKSTRYQLAIASC